MAGSDASVLSPRFLTPRELENRLLDLEEEYKDDPETKNVKMLNEFFEILSAYGYGSALQVYKMAKKY